MATVRPRTLAVAATTDVRRTPRMLLMGISSEQLPVRAGCGPDGLRWMPAGFQVPALLQRCVPAARGRARRMPRSSRGRCARDTGGGAAVRQGSPLSLQTGRATGREPGRTTAED